MERPWHGGWRPKLDELFQEDGQRGPAADGAGASKIDVALRIDDHGSPMHVGRAERVNGKWSARDPSGGAADGA